MLGRLSLTAIAFVATFAGLRADEAICRDGTHVAGQLGLTVNGRFVFRSADRDEPIGDIELVRFAPKIPVSPSLPLWHQVHLGDGQTILGTVLKLDATHLHVRTSWLELLAIPRVAIERVTDAPGMRPVFYDAFAGDLSNWETAGEPRTALGKLLLNRAGQSIQAKLKQPIAAGRFGVGFESARTTNRRCTLELHFERDSKPNVVSVELIGPAERFKVAANVVPNHEGKLRREAGSHRLSAEIDRGRLDIFVDDLVLWSQRSTAGLLRAIKLSAEGDGTEAAIVTDVLVAEPRPECDLQSWGDLTADAIRSSDRDETFGELTAAGAAGVTLRTKGRDLSLPWPNVVEFTFRRGSVTERPTAGEQVQVRVRSAEGVRDALRGAVKAFDEKSLVLMHPVLGELAIPRNRLEEIRLRFHGRMIPVDTTPRHLGNRPAFGFAVPKPEGLRFMKSVKIQSPKSSGFLIVDAAHLGAKGTPVEVRIAGESLGTLNRLADRADFQVRSYRLPLPAIREREIEVGLELRPSKDGGRISGIDLRAIRLELHDDR